MANLNSFSNFNSFCEPFHELEQVFWPVLFGHLSRFHNNTGAGTTTPSTSGPFKPRLNLHENTEKNLVTATLELPGIKKEDVQLNAHNGLLTISAENNISSEHDENGYAVRERRYGRYLRSLRLPEGIKDQDIKASMTDGVLTITFPKSSPEQEPKKITIA